MTYTFSYLAVYKKHSTLLIICTEMLNMSNTEVARKAGLTSQAQLPQLPKTLEAPLQSPWRPPGDLAPGGR